MRYRQNNILLAIVFLFLNTLFLPSQDLKLGSPIIQHHTKEDYSGGIQSWDALSSDESILYVGNNSGLLEYNGIEWKIYPLPKRTILRSLCISESGRIYVGGQDEIGYFYADDYGKLIFTSIRDQIPKKFLPLEDVWEMHSIDDKIYFRSINRIYIYSEDVGFEIIDPGNPISALMKAGEAIMYHDESRGVFTHTDSDTPLSWSSTFQGSSIISIVALSEKMLVLSEIDGGFFVKAGQVIPLPEESNAYIRDNRVFHAILLDSGEIAIATQFGGVLFINEDGKWLDLLTKNEGLQSNNINALCQDDNGDLWVCTANGIDQIFLNDPIRNIFPDEDNQGTIYDIELYQEDLYFATNNGLYKTNYRNEIEKNAPIYIKIKGSEGEVWGLDIIDDQLFMANNNGGFLIKDENASKISKEYGVWKFLPCHDSNFMYVGTYSGVEIYKKSTDTWIPFKKLEGFIESSRIMVSTTPNVLWVSHPYRGVYRLKHNDEYMTTDIQLFDETKGLPSILRNYIFSINQTPYVAAESGIYKYNAFSDSFILDSIMSGHFTERENVRRLIQQENGIIYFIAEGECGMLIPDGNDYVKKAIPELSDVFVGGFENLLVLDSNLILACTDRGALMYNSHLNQYDPLPKPKIYELTVFSPETKLVYGGHGPYPEKIVLNHKQNALKIKYGSNDHSEKSQYRVRLVGNEDEFSEWSHNTSKEYNNLKSEDYTLQIQIRNKNNVISEILDLRIEIIPPWYLSTTAYTIYWLLFIGAIASLYFIPNKKYKKEKAALSYEKEKTVEKLKQLKVEKLSAEIEHKNQELASSTMHLVQKNETLSRIKEEIETAIKKVQSTEARKELKKTLSHLSDDERLEEDWEKFSFYFDQVHSDFLKRLREEYPRLTAKDLKMAAYLRMNLATKEIAPLLNISVRGVEIGRYRLRKKLDMDTETNLNEYMMNF